MKRFYPLIMVLVILISCFSYVSAMDAERVVGDVLYHQDFSAVSDILESGLSIGSATSYNSMIGCPNESLKVETYDTGRVYVIFPEVERNDEGSYTIEFTFRFTDIHTENGYLAPILTCRGDEPSNISVLVIRANGTVDNFDEPDAVLREAIAGGEYINVKIPIRSWVLNEIIFTYNDVEYKIKRNNVLLVNEGGMGFVVRNANIAVDEIYVVHGTDYVEKTGYYAEHSYAADESPVRVPDNVSESVEYSPATADKTCMWLCFAVIGAFGACLCSSVSVKKRI